MRKAINLYSVNLNGRTKEKIMAIKEAGFDSIYTGIYNKAEDMTLDDIIAMFKAEGFFIPQMHCSYYEPNLKYLWQDGQLGDEQENDLKQQIIQTAGYEIENFVLHTNGEFNPPKTQTGIERIKRMLEVAEKYNVNLCIENLYDIDQMKYIFNHIESDRLKVCYDCGHHNCLNSETDLFNIFKDKITVLHLHDNFGKVPNVTGDLHKMLGEGNIDLDKLAMHIAQLPQDIALCAEYKVSKEQYSKEFFVKAKKTLDVFENKIELQRNLK